MTSHVPSRLRKLVRERAAGRCEYCLRHEDDGAIPHQPNHVLPRKYGGETIAENLAWACAVCNVLKGPETAAIDRVTDQPARLFHPRTDRWEDHFRLESGRIVGITPEGRVTEAVMQFNRKDLVTLRLALMTSGRYPLSR